MKHVLFLFLLMAAGRPLGAQRLVWLQQTPDGSVIANIHSTLTINPVRPVFSSSYDRLTDLYCRDSLFSLLQFYSPVYGTMQQKNAMLTCASQIDFTYPHLFSNHEWVNSVDLYPLLRVHSDFMRWDNLGNGRWEFNSSRHEYVCSKDKNGYTETDRQVWQLDGQQRVKTIYQLSPVGKTELRYDLVYTSHGKIEAITRTIYEGRDSTRYTQKHWQWLYDSRQRDALMISYEGPRRKFSATAIARFNRQLEGQLKAGRSARLGSLDSNRVKELVIYNYGTFGLEQINCYYDPDEYSNEIHFYSDSIFYNAAGKISRYVGGKNMTGEGGEFWYSYDEASGRLAQAEGRKYSECANRGCNEARIVQDFSYTDGKVSSLTQKRFEIRYQYKNGKYTDPAEVLQEERLYTYRYKPGKQ